MFLTGIHESVQQPTVQIKDIENYSNSFLCKDLLLLKFYNVQKTSEKKVAIDVLKALRFSDHNSLV